jgi:hypothetical protein
VFGRRCPLSLVNPATATQDVIAREPPVNRIFLYTQHTTNGLYRKANFSIHSRAASLNNANPKKVLQKAFSGF